MADTPLTTPTGLTYSNNATGTPIVPATPLTTPTGLTYSNNATGTPIVPATNASSGTISVSSTPQAPIVVPPAPVDTTNHAANMSGTNATLDANNANLTPPATPTVADNTSAIAAQLKALFPAPSSETDAYTSTYGVTPAGALGARNTAQGTANVDQAAYQAAQDEYNGYNAQLAKFKYLNDAIIPAQVENNNIGRGSQNAIDTQTRAQLRDNALAAAPIQFQALLAQSKVASALGKANLSQNILKQAQDQLDNLFKAQVDDNTAQYNYRTNIIDKAYTIATAAEKQRLDDIKTTLASNNTQYNAFVNDIRTAATSATTNLQGDVATKLAQLVNTLDPNSKTFTADMQKAQSAFATLQGQIVAPVTKLDTSIAEIGGRKVLVNNQTGATIKDLGSATVTTKSGGTTTTTPEGTTYKFTSTQTNTGAANATVSLDTFKGYSGDVQNFYVHASKANLTDLQNAVKQVKSGAVSAQDAKNEIDRLSIAPAVKDHIKSLIDSATPTQQAKQGGNFLTDTWNNIKSFLHL